MFISISNINDQWKYNSSSKMYLSKTLSTNVFLIILKIVTVLYCFRYTVNSCSSYQTDDYKKVIIVCTDRHTTLTWYHSYVVLRSSSNLMNMSDVLCMGKSPYVSYCVYAYSFFLLWSLNVLLYKASALCNMSAIWSDGVAQ
jgi:hypothetical protein